MAGTLHGLPIVACAFEFRFLGGSMGSVVGERFVRGAEHCLEHRAAGVLLRERRRAHAGSAAVAAADEQDQRGAGAHGRRRVCRTSPC